MCGTTEGRAEQELEGEQNIQYEILSETLTN